MFRQFDLEYDFVEGSCNTFSFPEEKVMMCFGRENKKRCDL